jgi:hypothetical protein
LLTIFRQTLAGDGFCQATPKRLSVFPRTRDAQRQAIYSMERLSYTSLKQDLSSNIGFHQSNVRPGFRHLK